MLRSGRRLVRRATLLESRFLMVFSFLVLDKGCPSRLYTFRLATLGWTLNLAVRRFTSLLMQRIFFRVYLLLTHRHSLGNCQKLMTEAQLAGKLSVCFHWIGTAANFKRFCLC